MKTLMQLSLVAVAVSAVAYGTFATVRVHQLEARASQLERNMRLVVSAETQTSAQILTHQTRQPLVIPLSQSEAR